MKEIEILIYLTENLQSEHITQFFGVNCSIDESEILIHVIIEKFDYSLKRFINVWKKQFPNEHLPFRFIL